MIYIIYGLSGPLKRLLVDPVVAASQKWKTGDNTKKITINRRGVWGKERRSYDEESELISYRQEEDLTKNCSDAYIFYHHEYRMAINKYEIDKSVKKGENHLIICHNSGAIKNIKRDYPDTQIIKITFTTKSITVLELACKRYKDDFSKRSQTLATIINTIEKEKIKPDIEIVGKIHATNYDEIGNYLYEELTNKINSKWHGLLNPKRSEENKEQDGFLAFEQDYNRVINSAAFRRLQDKAQVFPLEKNDYPRTRLTHSIECSAIAEELGIRVVEIIKSFPDFLESCYKIPTILKTAALLHDMGNPPFGHFGEDVIQHWFGEQFKKIEGSNTGKTEANGSILYEQLRKMQENEKYKNDLVHFEGNAQLFRLVTSLNDVKNIHRLNLTYATLAVILKYPTNSSNLSKNVLSKKKPGYFMSEEEMFKKVQENAGIKNNTRHPLTFLLEAADDIAYLTSDLQDAHHKKLITWEKHIKNEFDDIEEIKKYIGEIESIDDEKIRFEKVHVFLRKKMIEDAIDTFEKNYDQIMDGVFKEELLKTKDCNSKKIHDIIRNLLDKYVYFDDAICRSEIMANSILTKLLDIFVPAVLDYEPDTDKQKNTPKQEKTEKSKLNKKIICLLSDNYKEVCKKSIETKCNNEQDKIYHKILLATDYICGMTDSHAQQMYNMIVALPLSN